MIKQAEILGCLPEKEYEELFRLAKRKRQTPAVVERIEELRSLATVLHRQQREAEDAEIAANLAEHDAQLRAQGVDPETQRPAYW